MESPANFVRKKLLFGLFFLFNTLVAVSAPSAGGGADSFNPSEMILHHIADDYSWHIADYVGSDGKEHHVSIPLPVILYTDGGLHVFSSGEFHHAPEGVVRKGEYAFQLDHGHLKELSGKKFYDFSFTKNVASMFISVVVMFVVFFSVASAYKNRKGQAPKGLQSFMEPLIVFIRDDIARPNIGEKKYARYVPYLVCLFFFIWINNLLGLIPTGANASGNIAFTMTLAVITFIVTNVSGTKDYWGHIFWTPGVPNWLRPLLLPVEIIGIFTKPFALMIRLFANITAGHIIILSLISFIFVFKNALLGLPIGAVVIAMNMLELFVAVLQAYVFTILTALFIGLAVEEHEHDHAHEAEHGHH